MTDIVETTEARLPIEAKKPTWLMSSMIGRIGAKKGGDDLLAEIGRDVRRKKARPVANTTSDEPSARDIVAKLDIERRARRDALAEIPASDSLVPPPIAGEIETFVSERAKAQNDAREQRATELGAQTTALEAQDPNGSLDQFVERFERVDAPDITEESVRSIRALQAAERQATLRLRTFKADRGIARPVREPQSLALVLAMGAGVVLAEAWLNGHFLQDASAFGIYAGWLISGVVALANITLSSYAGFCFGRRMTIRPWRASTIVGVLGFGVWAMSMLLLHGLFVAFRTTATQAGEFHLAFSAAPALLYDQPLFWTADLSAMAFFGVGATFSVAAFLKGVYAFSDPIPGYSRVVEDERIAGEAVLDRIDEARDDLDFAADDAEAHIETRRREILRNVVQLDAMALEIEHERAEQKRSLVRLREAANEAMQAWRAEQVRIRSDLSPLPASALAPLKLDLAETVVDYEALANRVSEARRRNERAIASSVWRQARDRLERARFEAHARLADTIGRSSFAGDDALSSGAQLQIDWNSIDDR